MTGDLYVRLVIDQVPHGVPLRDQIALELRSHITERLERGQALDDVLRQLGDPVALAESYLAAVPLRSADVLSRLAAKLIDFLAVAGVVSVLAAAWLVVLPPKLRPFVVPGAILACVLGFVIYTVLAEYWYGRTLGKRLMGIQVVRESGRRISLGQAVVRQLPFFAQFFWIDALFALFTERRQRAFELLSKTRAVAMLLLLVMHQ